MDDKDADGSEKETKEESQLTNAGNWSDSDSEELSTAILSPSPQAVTLSITKHTSTASKHKLNVDGVQVMTPLVLGLKTPACLSTSRPALTSVSLEDPKSLELVVEASMQEKELDVKLRLEKIQAEVEAKARVEIADKYLEVMHLREARKMEKDHQWHEIKLAKLSRDSNPTNLTASLLTLACFNSYSGSHFPSSNGLEPEFETYASSLVHNSDHPIYSTNAQLLLSYHIDLVD
ncbi:hypothetical protein BDQ17DRAFT_1332858 [Cyathus striatus]|nr:hypothetical protein BDQ17DRAFT_1332858 [Cyathus striatus]